MAAINKQLKEEVITPTKPREITYDPNKLYWPYLRYNQLKPDVDYTMRILPSHEGNPQGYVSKEMYNIPYELDTNPRGGFPQHKCHYVQRPPQGHEDPIADVLKDFYRLMNDEEKGQSLRDELNTNEEFRMFIQTLAKPWGQYTIPVIIYATCETEQNAAGYNVHTNYMPDKRKKNYLFRLFQINKVKSFETKVIPNLVPKTFNSPEDYEGPFNDAEDGLDIKFSHSSSKPKTYSFTECDSRSALPAEVLDKLLIEGNQCNLVEKEITSNLKSSSEMMNLLKSSPYSQYLIDFGLIS